MLNTNLVGLFCVKTKYKSITVMFMGYLILACSTVWGEVPLIELKVKDQKYSGKRLIHDTEKVVLQLRDGEIKVIPLGTITGFRKTNETFKPYSMLQMRSELERDYIKEYEVKSNNVFVVVAPEGQAERYLTICQDMHRSFYHYFNSRGILLKELEFPLTVIILKNQQAFIEYGKSKNIKEINLLSGLYHPNTNRIVMHLQENANTQTLLEAPTQLLKNSRKQLLTSEIAVHHRLFFPKFESIYGGITKTVEETLCHEVTHQLAFNSNLHSRTSEYPRWVIEGLAMTFESPGNRSNSKHGRPMDRVNIERFLHFKSYVSNSRPSQQLEKFLAGDDQFKNTNQILDAYAESWALSFYLIETRPIDYGKYLQLLLVRPSFSYYKSLDRVNDFKSIFGNNLSIFEVNYLKYYNKLY